MLKAVVPFMVGIVVAEHIMLPLWLLLVGAVICGVFAIFVRSTIYAVAMLLLFGMLTADIHRSESFVPVNERLTFELAVDDIPTERKGYTSVSSTISAWCCGEQWYSSGDKVVLRADSTVVLRAGDRLIYTGYLRPFSSKYESYSRLMTYRGYVGMIRVIDKNMLIHSCTEPNSLHTIAAERLRRLNLEPDAQSVVSAMAAGDKSLLTPQLRAAYSRSGTSHLLAVSGLHVGIVFMLINLFMWWLPAVRRGHIVRNIVAIILIWLYASIAGFSPSVVRAAIMFSLLQFSLASTSAYVSMNILAATAMFMLIFNPNYLFDISFQLSFIAVGAIVAWGAPLYSYLKSRYKIINALIAVLAVGLVSAVATAPLVSHDFGIVSVVGLVINPPVIMLANVIVMVSVVWIVVPFGWLTPVFRSVLDIVVRTQNTIVEYASTLPYSAVEYKLSTLQTTIIYMVFIVATIVIWSSERKKSVSLPQ